MTFRQAINAICVDNTIKPPSDLLADRLVNFIQENYLSLTPEDLLQAFDWNLAGQRWVGIKIFGSIDKKIIGLVISEYLKYTRQRMQTQYKQLPQKSWTKKDSYDQLMDFYYRKGRYPITAGVFHDAYEYAVESGILRHQPDEFGKAVKQASKEIGRMVDLDKQFSKGREDDIMRLAKKIIFIRNHPKPKTSRKKPEPVFGQKDLAEKLT